MQISKKYEYRPFDRINSPTGRHYIVDEARPLPSVTTILSRTKDMTFLNEWKKRIGPEKAQQIVTEASGIGTDMHNNLEKYILGESMSGTVLSQSLAKVIIKNGLSKVNEVWGTEVALYSKELYAGTCDVIGLWNGRPAIMDFKNSLKEKKREWIDDYMMQLCAYKLSHDEMYGTDIRCGVIMMATRDGKYQEFVILDDEVDHYTYEWLRRVDEYYSRFGFE